MFVTNYKNRVFDQIYRAFFCEQMTEHLCDNITEHIKVVHTKLQSVFVTILVSVFVTVLQSVFVTILQSVEEGLRALLWCSPPDAVLRCQTQKQWVREVYFQHQQHESLLQYLQARLSELDAGSCLLAQVTYLLFFFLWLLYLSYSSCVRCQIFFLGAFSLYF